MPEERGWFARNWWVVAGLVAILAFAVFLRFAFNFPVFAEQGGELSGNDPYYHLRAIRTILTTGEHFFQDPMLNFPGGFKNVNPPTFNWTVVWFATILGPLFGGAVEAAPWTLAFSPTLWGTLTVALVYFITADVFDRKAGVVAALLMALMASHIERSMFGFGDHDSYALFFITLGMFFYLRSLVAVRRRDWVGSWTDGSSIVRGLREFASEGRLALTYAALAGVAIGNVALAWKGFHYATAIIFAYAVLQMIMDHLRQETSLDVFLVTAVTMLVTIALGWPYYQWASMEIWFRPTILIFTGFLVVGAWMVPTRDLPSILVLPGFVAFVVAGLGVLSVAFPGIANLLFGGFGYFQRSSVYQTIAEAHPPDFSLLVFNFGVATFYMALVGLVLLVLRIRRDPTRGRTFMLVWGAVAIWMAIAAARFLFNASPVFAIMSGWITWYIIDRLDYQEMAQGIRGYGRDLLRGLRKSVGISHIVGVLFIAFAIVVPNTYFAIDAGMPSEYENRLAQDNPEMSNFFRRNLGTFGQSYLPGYWEDGLNWLATQDTELPPAERPAMISWWDYGFWTSAIADHPVVADNFQNNYFFAGRFLAAQNSTHGIQILSAGYLEHARETGVTRERVADHLRDLGVEERNVTRAVEALAAFEYTPVLDHETTVELYRRVTDDTGKTVRYFIVDERLFPYDNPQTPQIERNSIFYAPMTLAEVQPQTFVTTMYTAQVRASQGQGEGRQVQLTQDQLTQLQQDPSRTVQVLGQSYRYQQKFFNSMLYKAYYGTPAQQNPQTRSLEIPRTRAQPGFGMENFRVVYQNYRQTATQDGRVLDIPWTGLRIVKFYFGANITGRVTMTDGQPVPRTTVFVLDEEGIPHERAITDRNGNFTIDVPFGENTLVAARGARQSQVQLGQSDPFNVTDREAMESLHAGEVNISVQPGAIEGTVFWDRDGDGAWNPENDTALDQTAVIVNQQISLSDDQGRYNATGVLPGPVRVTAQKQGYQAQRQRPPTVRPNATTVHNISMQLSPVEVSGTTFDDRNGDGEPQPREAVTNVTLSFTALPSDDGTAENATARSNATGGYSTQLKPGNYSWSAEGVVDGQTVRATGRLDVQIGQDPITLDVAVER